MSSAAVDSLGQGRVWSGLEARRYGLVDSLGGLPTAFQIALERAGYKRGASYSVERFPHTEKRFIERVVESWFEEDQDDRSAVRLPPGLETLIAAARFPAGAVLALMPFTIEIR
jgi:protease-4